MKCYVATVEQNDCEIAEKVYRKSQSAQAYKDEMALDGKEVTIEEVELKVVRLLKDVSVNIGLYAGRKLREWHGLPPRENGELWIEGDRRFRLNKSLEQIELSRFCILTPDEYEVIEA